jgi:hypothetical protein
MMERKLNYTALAISVLVAGAIFGYMLMETGKLEDAAAAHGAKRAELAASKN